MTEPDDARGPARPGAVPDPDPAELRIALAHADRLAVGAGPVEVAGDGAVRVVDALDRTRADLARRGDDLARDAPSMPPSVLAGLDRALAAERSAAPSRPSGLPRRPLRFPALRAARVPVLAAVLLVVLVAGLAWSGGGAPSAPPAAAPPAGGVPALTRADLGNVTVALRTGLGRADYGPLTDPARRAACLGTHGVPPGVAPVGARQVVVEGRPAVLFVLTTGVAARFRVLVVGAGCGAGEPLALVDRDVGR